MHEKRLRGLGKKGSLTDLALYVVLGFFLAVGFIVALFVNDIIKSDVIEGTELGNSSAASSIIDSFDTVNTYTTQRAYAMVMALLIISVIVSAFLVRLHPAFMFIYIIVLGFVIFVAAMLGNAYDDVMDNDKLAVIAQANPQINFFMDNIVIIVLVTGALSMFIAFSKIFQGFGGDDFT